MNTQPFQLGDVPWGDTEMVEAYPEFKEVYARKPVSDNTGGMKAPHAFLTWFMLSRLKPDLIVESGVYKGQGTWLIEQACPSARLICLDINFGTLTYRSKTADYIERDFSLIDFTSEDLSNALCFIDDHQNALMRLQQMKWKGFRQAIFEDNYPVRFGDCYSLKHAASGAGFDAPPPPAKPLGKRLRAALASDPLTDRLIESVPANETHRRELEQNLEVYYEGPPLFGAETTRWGDAWTGDAFPTKAPLFNATSEDPLKSEALDYTWMCYVRFK
ncbi:hypothetical protein Q5Y75_03710 [Ruegeria sp. 2205SS24-7]|uniref:hypothetical protein n=1 Tax=Ruegeria discodermiae TaxID=3064389 RepID=UPI0027421704|nr:hypothetical protein [Ruegeria sp. 2205SS24-7]MDP5216314.1 hypothetical protein [Ruegeria sp. 2205SS24-7]